jgi:uncharacterized protein YqkB
MAGWKKLITAESAANLTQVSASAGFSGSGEVLTFADTALAVGDSIIFRDADDGHIKRDTVADIVTTLAGDGIKNTSNQFAIEPNDFAGTGLEDDGSDNLRLASQGTGIDGGGGSTLSVAAAQTTITSIINSSLGKIGTNASQEYITFGTSDEVNIHIDNTERLSVTKFGADLTGNFDVTGAISASGNISGSGTSTGSFGHLVVGGGEFSSASLAAAIANDGDITGVTAGDGLSGGGSSGGVTLDVAGAQTSITSIINSSFTKLGTATDQEYLDFGTSNQVKIGVNDTDRLTVNNTGVVVTGNLTVNGTTTTVNTTNTEVTDKFILLNSGSNSGDGGIIVSNGTPKSGSAFAYDDSENRWGFTGSMGTSTSVITPDAYVAAVVTDDDEAVYRKNGNIRVESGEIYIYVE